MTPRSRPGRADNYGFVRRPRIADLMTADLDRFVESSRAAERAGDAATALDYHLGVPMFARGAHAVLLKQLVPLAGEMTPWMWARWAAYQCTRAEEPEHETGQRTRAAAQYTLEMFYVDRLEQAQRAGEDWMQVAAGMLGQCWLYHQLATFELGGLASFLDELATGELLQESTLARSWVGAPMGGYRLRTDDDGGLVVRDLATGDDVQLLDLGAGLAAATVPAAPEAGAWVIGRLVPSGTEPALMFDSRPIAVDEPTAREVALSADAGWVSVVERALHDGRIDLEAFESEDREVVTDVQSLDLVFVATPRQALESTLDQLARGRDEVGRAAHKILRGVGGRHHGAGVPPAVVAAAVLQPHAWAEAQRSPAGDPATWQAWARQVPEPARSRLERLADAARMREAG